MIQHSCDKCGAKVRAESLLNDDTGHETYVIKGLFGPDPDAPQAPPGARHLGRPFVLEFMLCKSCNKQFADVAERFVNEKKETQE